MLTYAANNLPALRCWRCGELADVDWFEVQAWGAPAPMCIVERMTCSTPGCVNEDGSNAASERPPSPSDIQRKANAIMDRFWKRMLEMTT